ncbi:hypothetical protein ALC62_07957, partial [Cyphomyrmex costatus]
FWYSWRGNEDLSVLPQTAEVVFPATRFNGRGREGEKREETCFCLVYVYCMVIDSYEHARQKFRTRNINGRSFKSRTIDTIIVHNIVHVIFSLIAEPVTEIAGGPDLYINKDSTINLTCYVRHAPEPPSTIIWSHNHQAINFDSPRGGISLVTEKGPVTSSRLLIQKAIDRDSGLYTCSPNNTHPNSVRVHIVNEEHPAAMHHGRGDRMAATLLPVVLLLRMIF